MAESKTLRSIPALNQAALGCSYNHIKHVVPLKRIGEALVLAANADTEEEDYENAYTSYTQALNLFEKTIPSLPEYQESIKTPEIGRYFELIVPKVRRKQSRIVQLLDDARLPLRSTDEPPLPAPDPITFATTPTVVQPRLPRKSSKTRRLAARGVRGIAQANQTTLSPQAADDTSQRRREPRPRLKRSEQSRIKAELSATQARRASELMARLQAEETQRREAEEKRRRRETALLRAQLSEKTEQSSARQSATSTKSTSTTSQPRVHFEPTFPSLPELPEFEHPDLEMQEVLRHGHYQQQRQRRARRQSGDRRSEWSHLSSLALTNSSVRTASNVPSSASTFPSHTESFAGSALGIQLHAPAFTANRDTSVNTISSSEDEDTKHNDKDADDEDEDEEEEARDLRIEQEERHSIQYIDGTSDFPSTTGAIDPNLTSQMLIEAQGAKQEISDPFFGSHWHGFSAPVTPTESHEPATHGLLWRS